MKHGIKKHLLVCVFAILTAVSLVAFAGCDNQNGNGGDSHRWQKIAETAPSCEKNGVKEHYECSHCGGIAISEGGTYVTVGSEDLIIPAGHRIGEEIAEKPATCGESGVKAHYECSACHKLFVYENGGYAEKTEEQLSIAKKAHVWGALVQETPATCGAKGIKAHYECVVCGAKSVKESDEYVIKTDEELFIPATGAHTWGALIAEKSATCKDFGEKAHYECTVCGKKAIKEGNDYVVKTDSELALPKTDAHVWGALKAEKSATCKDFGEKAHYECTVCGKKAVKEGNDYVVKTESELLIQRTEHTFGEEIAEVPADCDKEGFSAHYECRVCGAKAIKENDKYKIVGEEELIIAASHKWGALIKGVSATCTADGQRPYKQCEACGTYAICDGSGRVLNISAEASALKINRGHRYALQDDGGYLCSDCGNYLTANPMREINLNVHDEGGDYVCDEGNIVFDLTSFGLSEITKVTFGSGTLTEFFFEEGVLTLPYEGLKISESRYYYGNYHFAITGKTDRNAEEKITFPALIKTKVLTSAKDLQDFGKIALAQADNDGISSDTNYSYGGYFELGADIDCEGKRYTMVASVSQQISYATNGFKGVFDGKGYSIKNLLIGADKIWYNGWDDTPDNVYKSYSFFGRLDGGKICNVSFIGVKLNPIASVICSSGYGEISNVYAQIARCAIIKDKNSAGEVIPYAPLGFCFSQGANGNSAKTKLHEIIVDYVGCEYYGFDKANEYPKGSGLATYDSSYGFIDDAKIYNVFGTGVSSLENCYVIGYPGTARNGEKIFSSYQTMNIEQTVAEKFDSSVFAQRDGMIIPVSYAAIYDNLPATFTVSVDSDVALPNSQVKTELGDFKYFASLVSESDKIKYVNGYIAIDKSVALGSSIKFYFEMKGRKSNELTIRLLDEGGIFDEEVASWKASGAILLGSALNSSDVAGKIGSSDVYKAVGGWNVDIANAGIDVADYKELYFIYKTSVSVSLSSSNGNNDNKGDTWYCVKLERQANNGWKIYVKTSGESGYTELVADPQYFSAETATFTTLFKTWRWRNNKDECAHDVYATDVYGISEGRYINVEKAIERLPETVTSSDVSGVLETLNAYENLPEEQKAKISSAAVEKLNSCAAQTFALEISEAEEAGASKKYDSAMNGTAVKSATYGAYEIYKMYGLKGMGGRSIGVSFDMNTYAEIYFAFKSTAKTAIFSGSNTPQLAANKWYTIKLVKGEEHWEVYAKAFGEEEYAQITLDSYDYLGVSGQVWFNSEFKTAEWTSSELIYDVYTSAVWAKAEASYVGVEKAIEGLPETVTSSDVSGVLEALNAYENLSEEQKAKISSAAVEKLNSCAAQTFALEISEAEEAGASKKYDSAMNGTAVKSATYGAYEIYKMYGLKGMGGRSIGVSFDMNTYAEIYFAFKSTAKTAIFSGSNTPQLAANKWYTIKLVKGEEHWEVYAKAFGEEEYAQITLDSYDYLGVSGQVWFNSEFKTAEWTSAELTYDVYTSAVWAKAEASYVGVEKAIERLPETVTSSDVSGVLEALNAYENLSEEQKAKISSAAVEKLNSCAAQTFALEISESEEAGASKKYDSAMNGTAVKSATYGAYDIYKMYGLKGMGGRSIGVSFDMNTYAEIYFAFKSTAKTAIFSGSNTPQLAANKWYTIKLVKGEEHWEVYAKAFGEEEYAQITLDSYDYLGVSGQVWFNSEFKTAEWTSAELTYDVYTSAVWAKAEEAYNKTERRITALPETVTSSEEIKQTVNVYYEYENLSEEQKAKISSAAVEKLNSCFAQAFASETDFVKSEGIVKVSDSAMNGKSVKDGAFGAYDIYKMSDISGYGGQSIGYGCNMNDYSELYFAIKIPANVTIFSGLYNKPSLSADKWYMIKLVKGEEHWEVYAKALGETEYTQIELDSYNSLKISGQVWFSSEFKTVRWSNAENVYDVYTTGLWAKK